MKFSMNQMTFINNPEFFKIVKTMKSIFDFN